MLNKSDGVRKYINFYDEKKQEADFVANKMTLYPHKDASDNIFRPPDLKPQATRGKGSP